LKKPGHLGLPFRRGDEGIFLPDDGEEQSLRLMIHPDFLILTSNLVPITDRILIRRNGAAQGIDLKLRRPETTIPA